MNHVNQIIQVSLDDLGRIWIPETIRSRLGLVPGMTLVVEKGEDDGVRLSIQSDLEAMHKGQVIDHGPDLRTLHLRVFARLGHIPVLLKRVTDEPERELVFQCAQQVAGAVRWTCGAD